MFQVRLTEATSITVDVDYQRIWLTFPNHTLGLTSTEAGRLATISQELSIVRPMLLWIKALKSGKYKQCRGRLHQCGVGHCCLGVLCEVAIEAGVHVPVIPGGLGNLYGGSNTCPPRLVLIWLGAQVPIHELARLNDSDGWSFDQIADHLLSTYVLPRFQ